MKKSSIKKINTAGKIGYVVSILLIVCTIVAMVGIAICTVGAFTIVRDDINVKIDTTIKINSKGNFLEKINSFIFVDGVNDLNDLTREKDIKVNDKDFSELSVVEENGGLNINAKTNEITISMNRIIVALIAIFIFLGAIIVALYMVKSLMKSLKTCETPFTENVIKNMSRFSTSLIVVAVLKFILSGFWSSIRTGSSYTFSFDLGTILLVAVIYILVAVFKYGAELQQESDETL